MPDAMPERREKKRHSLSDALTSVRPGSVPVLPPSAPVRTTSRRSSASSRGSAPTASGRGAQSKVKSAEGRGEGTAGSSLPLAVRRHVLSAARAYLTERRRNAASSAQPRETRPVELQQALQETLEASRRTSKAMRFIKHLKENSIEQKLLAMQQRVNCEDDTPGGSDQMLEEACHLAAQLHELSNNESVNSEISQIADSIPFALSCSAISTPRAFPTPLALMRSQRT